MATVIVQIGNSDDKLSQRNWVNFAAAIDGSIIQYAKKIHFTGMSHGKAPWQNAAWVFEIEEPNASILRGALMYWKGVYNQESIAWTEGETVFI